MQDIKNDFQEIKRSLKKKSAIADKKAFVSSTSKVLKKCMTDDIKDAKNHETSESSEVSTDEILDRLVKRIPHSPSNHRLIEKAASLVDDSGEDAFIITSGYAATQYAKEKRIQTTNDVNERQCFTCCLTRKRSSTC